MTHLPGNRSMSTSPTFSADEASGVTGKDPTLHLDSASPHHGLSNGNETKIHHGGRHITHVIFDLDGVLLDTESIYTNATQKLLDPYGHTFTWQLKVRMMGKPPLDAARILIDELSLPISADSFVETMDSLLNSLFQLATPMPGAVRLTRHLANHHVPQAVATSTSVDLLESKLARHREWFSIFHTIIAGDNPEIKQGKPAPDIFLLAARRLGAPPEHCVVFEDSLAGMQAALAANMCTVAIPSSNLDRSTLPAVDYVVDSLDAFDPASLGLPEYA